MQNAFLSWAWCRPGGKPQVAAMGGSMHYSGPAEETSPAEQVAPPEEEAGQDGEVTTPHADASPCLQLGAAHVRHWLPAQ